VHVGAGHEPPGTVGWAAGPTTILDGSLLLVRCVALVAALLGCGGGSAKSDSGQTRDGGEITSVDGSASLNNLSPSQMSQLCSDVDKFSTGTLVRDVCRLQAYSATAAAAAANQNESDADLRTACSTTYEQCAGPSDAAVAGNAGGGLDGGVCAGLSSSQCTATVAELTTCLSDLNGAYQAVPDCSALSRTSLTIDAGPTATKGAIAIPGSCVTLNANCPGTGLIHISDGGQ
jgi:hypothetical protein